MDSTERHLLLRIAAEALCATVEGRAPLDQVEQIWPDPARRGVFVTLRSGGQLRGCIGTIQPLFPLPCAVRDMAVAVVNDPRFADRLIQPIELPDLDIELSVLSPLIRTSDPLSLQIGTHGVYIRTPSHSGCFLPQVAVEAQWNALTFLSRCCESKAHTFHDAWRDPDTEVYLFTTECFGARLDMLISPDGVRPGC